MVAGALGLPAWLEWKESEFGGKTETWQKNPKIIETWKHRFPILGSL